MNTILYYLREYSAATGPQELLLDMAVKGTAILLAAGVLVLLLRRKSASVRAAVWALALASVLLLPVLSTFMPRWQARILPERSMSAHLDSMPVEQRESVQTLPEYEGEEYVLAAAPDLSPGSRIDSGGSEGDTASHDPAELSGNPPTGGGIQLWEWVYIGWLLGAACTLFPSLAGLICLGIRSRHGTMVAKGRMTKIMRQAITDLGIIRPVCLLEWNGKKGLTMPTTWGLYHPVVMMPSEANQWPEDRIRVALMHELAHVKRGDWALQILVRLACAAYWYNPLIWIASRSVRIASEEACDNVVLQAGQSGPVYATHLLDIVKTMCVQRHTALMTVPMARVNTVERRIRAILDTSRRRREVPRCVAISATILMVMVLIPLVSLHATTRTALAPGTTETISGGTNIMIVTNSMIITVENTALQDVSENQSETGLDEKITELKKRYDNLHFAGQKMRDVFQTRVPEKVEPLSTQYVRLVADSDGMTFQGKPVTWESLPGQLAQSNNRSNTVFECARTMGLNDDSGYITVLGTCVTLGHTYGFARIDDIGRQPLGSLGTVACEGPFTLNQQIPLALSAGTAEKAGVVTARTIVFTRDSDTIIKGTLTLDILSAPRTKWLITVALYDKAGKEIDHALTSVMNSGMIYGVPVVLSRDGELLFGLGAGMDAVQSFRISIQETDIPPVQVAIKSILLLKSATGSRVLSSPNLVCQTGKKAEVRVGGEETVPGAMVTTGITLKMTPEYTRPVLKLRGTLILAELSGVSTTNAVQRGAVQWHNTKANTTDFDIRVKNQEQIYSIGPVPYSETEELYIQMSARIVSGEEHMAEDLGGTEGEAGRAGEGQ